MSYYATMTFIFNIEGIFFIIYANKLQFVGGAPDSGQRLCGMQQERCRCPMHRLPQNLKFLP